MTIKFKIRVSRRIKEGELVPVYIRLLDGVACDQTVKTRILVRPEYWDSRAQGIKPRCLCLDSEKRKLSDDILSLRSFVSQMYYDKKSADGIIPADWLASVIRKYYKDGGKKADATAPAKQTFDSLYDRFLDDREIGEGRKRHYEVLRRMIHRYESYVRCSRGRRRYTFDVVKTDRDILEDLYDYIENEFEYVQRFPEILKANPEAREIKPRGENYLSGVFKELRAFFNWAYRTKIIEAFPFEGFTMPSERYGSPIYLSLDDVQKIWLTDFSSRPSLEEQRDIFVFQCNVGCRVGDLLRLKKQDVINGAVEYIPTKTIKETARTVVVPLNKIALEIVEKYSDLPGESLLPFISSVNYNDSIKDVLEFAGITYLVTELDTVTRKEKKVHINDIASSHLARRTFIGNIYKLVKDPNLVSALTGHVEGSRAFTRYRTIDIDMKKDLVKILEGNAK